MENTNLKPVIRFPEFTENWQETKFKNHFEFKNTNSLSRDKLNYESGTIKNIHYGDIHTKFNTHFDIEKEELPFINEDVDITRIDDENYVLEGDLVMADASEDYADIGKSIEVTNTNNEKILAGLHTFLARKTDETLACSFFGHLLANYNVRLELMRIAQGTKVLGLSKGRVEQIALAIPKPEEQEKISNSLTTVDNRIALLKEKKDNLLDFKKGVMQKIFNQDIRFKDDNGNVFPDWEEKKLGEISNITIGEFVKKTKQNPDSKYPVYNGGKSWTGFYDEFNNKGNKILISARGANAGYVNFEKRRYWAGNSCYSIELNDKNCHNIEYFYYYIKYHEKRFTSNQQAANIPAVSKKDVSVFKVIYPSFLEQIKIANYLTILEDKIEALQQKIDASVDFKKGLLQKMFV